MVKESRYTRMKVAVSTASASRVRLHSPEPVQPSLQPTKREPTSGSAMSDTAVPESKGAVQVCPQSMPAGDERTVPEPFLLTASEKRILSKMAVTTTSTASATAHCPEPVQSPLQPANLQPAAGVATSDTDVPVSNWLEQVAPQSMPAGLDTTRPDPCSTTLSRCVPCGGGGGFCEKAAVRETSLLTVSWQGPLPPHAPDQPVNVAPGSGTASNCTWVPVAKAALQLPRQSVPAPRTRPSPVVEMRTVAWLGPTEREGGEPFPQDRQRRTTKTTMNGRMWDPQRRPTKVGARSAEDKLGRTSELPGWRLQPRNSTDSGLKGPASLRQESA